MEGVDAPHRRPRILQQITEACESWGFFQVINHGIPISVLDGMIDAVHKYNREPMEEKAKYYNTHNPNAAFRYLPNYNSAKEKVMEWKDTVTVRYAPHPPAHSEWPPSCRDASIDYCEHTKALGATLLTLLAEALCLPPTRLIDSKCMRSQLMYMSYYPSCPQPDLTLGLSGHSDPGAITLLLQDQVGGLQVSNKGRWVAVQPLHGSLVINLGDTLQILSNGRFKSVEHRVVTNAQRSRVSVPTFFLPGTDCTIKIAPIPELLDEHHPPLYKEIAFKDYTKHFLTTRLDGKSCLDLVKIN
eukprot:Gb_00001 [translate_table: standard]